MLSMNLHSFSLPPPCQKISSASHSILEKNSLFNWIKCVSSVPQAKQAQRRIDMASGFQT